MTDDRKRPLEVCKGCVQLEGCRNVKCLSEFECPTYRDRKKGIERHTIKGMED